MAYTPNLDQQLVDGYRQTWDDRVFVVECHELEPVTLPTGHVVACDALASKSDLPFTATVTPGTYPMYAWVAVLFEKGEAVERRNAALELRVSESPTVSWEMALTPEESMHDLDTEDDFFGYVVDTGCGTLADAEAVKALWQWDFERTEAVYIPNPLPTEPVPGYISAVVDLSSGANVSVIGSGWGDGTYPTFIGRDASGDITRFVTDFLVLDPKTLEETTLL